MNQNLPQDPMMLFSYVNTKLRDEYPSLTEWCKAEGVEEESIVKQLAAVGFEYSAELNKFW